MTKEDAVGVGTVEAGWTATQKSTSVVDTDICVYMDTDIYVSTSETLGTQKSVSHAKRAQKSKL